MKLIDKLTREQRRQLAAAARKVRPSKKQRAEFRVLTRRRRELKLRCGASKPSGNAA
jgi:hypothetical protein